MELDITTIEYELGKLMKLEQLCMGVWYAAMNNGKPYYDEYYLADTDALCLSDYAKSLGKKLDDLPELLLYPLDEIDSGKFVVKYEVQRFLILHNLPPMDDDSLLSTAVFGTEHHPDYFGDYPAPLYTPRGMTTRRRKIMTGVFAVETEKCETMVAVCNPIWPGELSEYVQKFGEQIDDNELGYMFFTQPADSLVLFELRQTYGKLADNEMINWPALMNAIWRHYPEYAAAHNSREQHGLNDVAGLMFQSLGFDVELKGEAENLIVLSLGESDTYLKY